MFSHVFSMAKSHLINHNGPRSSDRGLFFYPSAGVSGRASSAALLQRYTGNIVYCTTADCPVEKGVVRNLENQFAAGIAQRSYAVTGRWYAGDMPVPVERF